MIAVAVETAPTRRIHAQQGCCIRRDGLAGQHPYEASVPVTLMWTQLYQRNNATAAAVNATILLVLVAVVVIPYLVHTTQGERESRG